MAEQQKIDYFAMVEQAWDLSDQAREFAKNAGRELQPNDYWEPIFSKSGLVDVARTQREGGNPLQRIFFSNPYGLQYRNDHKDWIPFRHGEINIALMMGPE